MSKQTQFHSFIDGGSITVVGPLAITFPTTLLAKTQGTNASATAINAADTIVLAANANRKFAQIQNQSGVTLQIAFGNAATSLSFALPSGGVFTIDANTIGEINQEAVHIRNDSGANRTVMVYEE